MTGFEILILVMMIGVALILISGLVVMAIGGKTNEKHGNKLMAARVGFQALAVMLIGALFLFSR